MHIMLEHSEINLTQIIRRLTQTMRQIVMRGDLKLINIIGNNNYYFLCSFVPYLLLKKCCYRNSYHGPQNPFGAYGPFDSSKREHFDAWSTNPFIYINVKRVFVILFGITVFNFLMVR